MSDGGEGLLDALGGTRRSTIVTGPLGARVDAEWRMLEGPEGEAPLTAVVEMSGRRGAPSSRAHGRRPGARHHDRRGPAPPGRPRAGPAAS